MHIHNQQVTTVTGPMLVPIPKCAETRVNHTQYDMDPRPANEPKKMVQSGNEDHQLPPPSQSAMVSLCPIPISESTTGSGAGLLSFGTVVEPAYCGR